jgi:hypothetical protein
MKLSPEIKAAIVAAVSGVAAVGIAFAAGGIFRPKPIVASGAMAAFSERFAPLFQESPGSMSDKIGQKEAAGRWQENQTADDYTLAVDCTG